MFTILTLKDLRIKSLSGIFRIMCVSKCLKMIEKEMVSSLLRIIKLLKLYFVILQVIIYIPLDHRRIPMVDFFSLTPLRAIGHGFPTMLSDIS